MATTFFRPTWSQTVTSNPTPTILRLASSPSQSVPPSGFSSPPSIPADPKVIGPGIWIVIHQTAKRAIDEPSKQSFVNLMKMLADQFPCDKCRRHINEYLQENPFEPYWNINNDIGDPIGLFKWSWNFHNTVNLRLNKSYIDFDTAWNLYSDKGIVACSSGCSDKHSNSQSQELNIPQKVNPALLRSLRPSLFS